MRCYCSPAHQNLTSTVGAVMGGSPTPAGGTAVVPAPPDLLHGQNCTFTTLGPEMTLHPIAGRAEGVGSSLGALALGVGKVVGSL